MDFSIKTFSIDTLSCLFSTVSKIKNKHSAIKLTIDLLIKVCAKKKKRSLIEKSLAEIPWTKETPENSICSKLDLL